MSTKSFSTSNSYSFSRLNIDEHEWVENTRKSILEHDDDEIAKIPVCIFTVPQVLLATDPESYIPQQVALGPFHHWRPEVYDMQRYKLAAARRTQKRVNVSFERIVEAMKKDDEARIRACYHKFLDMSRDALVWMMAVDMAFLLEFLQVYFMKEEGQILKQANSEMSHVVDITGKKLSHMAILRDVIMVENQIPMFLIRTMLTHQFKRTKTESESESKSNSADETLKTMLMGLYRELTPFNETELPDVNVSDCDHLLDFLYHMTVPNNKELGIMDTEIEIGSEIVPEVNDGEEKEEGFEKEGDVKKVMDYVWNVVGKSNAGLVRFFKSVVFGKPMILVMKLPWKIISNLPLLKLMKEPVERVFARLRGEGEKKEDDKSGEPKVPTIEEITIPSVTDMAKAGILFAPVNGGISDMSFDTMTSTLYLPVIDLDVNTEVYLRNLVAYEACVAAGPLVVARYTELMNGIIDTEEDAKYLRERGIVLNHLKSDKEVADLWNGMSKCVKLTRVPKMDKVIEDVNQRYAKTWRVKFSNFMNNYVFGSWKFLTILAALFLLLLTGLQSFCSVYSCARVFHHLPDVQGGTE